MKNLFSILTGSAAGFMAIGAASAADLPSKKAAPAQYVKICDAYGAGYFYIPGSDTCLKIGGQVRAEYTYRAGAATSPKDGAGAFTQNQGGTIFGRDETAFRGRAYMTLDARTKTSYGDLKTFIQLRMTDETTNSGPIAGGKLAGQSTAYFQGYGPGTATYVTNAYIQFAGITAGRAQSMFDFYTHSYEVLGSSFVSDQPTNLLAYTAKFGSGFSATLSAEDRSARIIADTQGLAPTKTKSQIITYDGARVPDLVANLRVDQSWGAAQISGAYHAVKAGNSGVTTTSTATGYAFSAGVKVLLPMLAAGDSISIQGTLAKGATDYTNPLNFFSGISSVYKNKYTVGVSANDGYVQTNGQLALAKTYSFFAGIQHFFSPQVRSSLFSSYLNVSYAQSLGTAANSKVYLVGTNVIWMPVKGVEIGPEVVYTHVALSSSIPANLPSATVGKPNSGGDVRARLTIRAAF